MAAKPSRWRISQARWCCISTRATTPLAAQPKPLVSPLNWRASPKAAQQSGALARTP
ncbi:UNVERIFIED_CONTAM: hypothetical protein GTU68_051526 [Idotea baltica]|nr:hypothetical protein [Idotea baltica]